MSYVLIIGATSDMGKAIAREFAQQGYDLYLAARNSEVLTDFKQDLIVRSNRQIELIDFDLLKLDTHETIYNSLS